MSSHDCVQKSNFQTTEHKTPESSYRLTVPSSIRQIFDQFPLVKYIENTNPARTIRYQNVNTLYIFTLSESSSRTNLSCNPACLKWQAYLIFKNIPFVVRSSNNHASPSGALPFLIPARQGDSPRTISVTSSKLSSWVATNAIHDENTAMEHEIHSALLERNLRNGWLYHLYIDAVNFDTVAKPLYVYSSSSNGIVRWIIAHQLREAALKELLKSRETVERDEIYEAVDEAFRALAAHLGDDFFFSRTETPGLFDASLFAYTHLLLDTSLCWKNSRMQDVLQQYPRLVYHRNRILELCLRS